MVIQKLHNPRQEILKKRHLIAATTVKNLQEAVAVFNAHELTADEYPHIRLSVIHSYERAFHAVCNYLAEELQSDYACEMPEQSAQQLFQQAYISDLITKVEYKACLQLINVYSLTPEVLKKNIAQEVCQYITELVPVLYKVVNYPQGDLGE